MLNVGMILKMFGFCLIDFSVSSDGGKVTTVIATPGAGPDRPQEIRYTDTKPIGNGSFGVVYQAKLCDTGELVAIKKVLQDKRFKVCNYSMVDKSTCINKRFFEAVFLTARVNFCCDYRTENCKL